MLKFFITFPFYVNDLLFIQYQSNFWYVLAIDYLTRVIVLAILFVGLAKKYLAFAALNLLSLKIPKVITGSILLSTIGIAIDQSVTLYLKPVLDYTVLFTYPAYPVSLKIIDLTLGLTLVSFSEEIVFRGVLLFWLESKQMRQIAIILTQSTLFGLIHWSNGVHSIIGSFLWAIAPAIYVLRYRSIWPAIIAHYVTDFVAFI